VAQHLSITPMVKVKRPECPKARKTASHHQEVKIVRSNHDISIFVLLSYFSAPRGRGIEHNGI
jgi:hypothetical protein